MNLQRSETGNGSLLREISSLRNEIQRLRTDLDSQKNPAALLSPSQRLDGQINQKSDSKKRLDGELSFSGDLTNSDLLSLKQDLTGFKLSPLKNKEERPLLGIFVPQLSHSNLSSAKKNRDSENLFLRQEEHEEEKQGEPTFNLMKCSSRSIEPDPVLTIELKSELEELKNNYEELVQEFCKVKVQKVEAEREIIDILNCIENLENPKNVPCSVVRESVKNLSAKTLARLSSYFKGKNFIL